MNSHPWSVQGQVEWGFEQCGLVDAVSAHGRGVGRRWSITSLLIKTILWFYDISPPLVVTPAFHFQSPKGNCQWRREGNCPLWLYFKVQMLLSSTLYNTEEVWGLCSHPHPQAWLCPPGLLLPLSVVLSTAHRLHSPGPLGGATSLSTRVQTQVPDGSKHYIVHRFRRRHLSSLGFQLAVSKSSHGNNEVRVELKMAMVCSGKGSLQFSCSCLI